MGLFGTTARKRIVVRTYGRGSFLGMLSPFLAAIMARQGMHGWQDSAVRAMEDDAVAMARQGYRVASSEECGIPRFGITYYRVTYEQTDPPGERRPS